MRGVFNASPPLTVALAVSALLHAGLAVVAVAGLGASPAPRSIAPALQALILAAAPAFEPLASLEPVVINVPRFEPLSRALLAPPEGSDPPGHGSSAAGLDANATDVPVAGVVLADHNRLGPFLQRQIAEFPVEMDSPVRIGAPIVARYPAAALRDGLDTTVVVWVVVGWNGRADEVEVSDGDPLLAEAVIAAVKDAQFVPARNRLLATRYPIALEFRFDDPNGRAGSAITGDAASRDSRAARPVNP